MKKALVLLVVTVLVVTAIQDVGNSNWTPILLHENHFSPISSNSGASVSGGGSSQTATMFFDRTITGQQIDILNTYGDTAMHIAELDLSPYQVPGWRLSDVQIDIGSINASAEKEVVGQTYENLNFQVAEILGTFRSQIAQGFYNYSHNGVLLNYSIYYITDRYSPPARGNASLVVRSGDQIDTASDITTPENMTASEGVFSWVTVSGENATLSANTLHWVVVDGRQLHEAAGYYPTIFWTAEDSDGTYPSKWYDPPPNDEWDTSILEALLNYTYIPWNQTANAPLTYSSPQQVDLKGNSSAITSSSFSFSSSTKNITSISFNTNQSVCFNYNLTLSYIRDTSASVSWEVLASGSLVDWSVSISTSYPSVSGQVSRYLNISKANSWTITGLYENAAPATNHTNFTLIGTIVRCASMTDGTWRLTGNSYNHLSAVNTYDSSDNSELISLSSILVNVDVNLTILEQDSDPVSTGLANLTIIKGGSIIWSPINKSVSSGKANYLWNIDSTTSDNGAFTLEVSWANGTDAGYLMKELVVFYPTSLAASESNIDTFTESTFEVRVYFQDTFTPQGLYGAAADAVYSFAGGSNVSMTDHSNGTWSATISTAGKDPGTYLVDIFSEGYALQNRSVQITVNLIHDTEALTVSWSNTNDITYIETTELSVYYNRVTGSAPIPGATVNATINAMTWPLVWDGVSAYKITFNGTDNPPDFGVHNITIEAWKAGHKAQSNSIQTLTIQEEPTSLTYTWSNTNSITYVESTTLSVNYTKSDGTAVLGAIVNVTISSDTFDLIWNGGTETYDYVFTGDALPPGIGIHSLTIEANKHGHEYKNALSVPFTITKESTTLFLTWSYDFNISYIEETYLIAFYNMSDGSPVLGAMVNVTIDSNVFTLDYYAPIQGYRVLIRGLDNPPGLGVYLITVQADLYGYVSKTDSSKTLVLREDPTTLLLSWSDGNSITYLEQTTLSATYTMSNSSAIRDALVNVTIGTDIWQLIWHEGSQTYRVTFLGVDNPPGFGTHNLTVEADLFGFVSGSDSSEQLTVSEEPTTMVYEWSNSNDITFIESTTLSVNYTKSDGTAVVGTTVNVTIDSDIFTLVWNGGTEIYEYVFDGDASPPGIGIHSLTIEADKYGYEYKNALTVPFTITKESTSLSLMWSNDFNITYIEETYLIAFYNISDGSPVLGALVNVTIDSNVFVLDYYAPIQGYRVLIRGTDNPPGFGVFPITVRADLFGYVSKTDSSETLVLQEDPTTLLLSWSDGYNITHFEQTILSAAYTMSNGSAIRSALVNVTIGGNTWLLMWHEGSQTYRKTFFGPDDPPGYGSHGLTVEADKFGYVARSDSSETLTLTEVYTDYLLTWSFDFDITYIEETYLIINYTMINGTAVQSATVNVTININVWTLNWHAPSQTYRLLIKGSDNPPGLGVFPITVRADRLGFVSHTDSSKTLILQEDPTTLLLSWSDGSNITYIEETILSASYTMSNGSAIRGAQVNVTIGGNTWILVWHEGSQTYQKTFLGSDDPPGFGNQGLTVEADLYGFMSRSDSSEQLTVSEEPTSMVYEWSNSNDITFIESTTLSVNYTKSDGTAVVGAIVNVTIGSDTFTLVWHGGTEIYEYTFDGDASPPGIGIHSLTIEADKYGYEYKNALAVPLTITEEPTSLVITWSVGNNITYVEETYLIANYTRSNGSPVIGALVNVTIGIDTWTLSWHAATQTYRKLFTGADKPPGFGTHSLTIQTDLFGYVTKSNTTEQLIIGEEMTSLVLVWSNTNSITFIEQTTLSASYTMSNTTAIRNALVNVSIGITVWQLVWHEASDTYRVTFLGSVNPPGFGTHSVTVLADLFGFQSQSDSTNQLIISEEPTDLVITWSAGNDITYIESTTLIVNYTMSDGSPVLGATVNVTIGSDTFILVWNGGTGTYEYVFDGDASPPGIGIHSLTIESDKHGHEYKNALAVPLTITEEPTSLVITWFGGNDITYLESTTLIANYTMSDGSPVLDALVNVTIGLDTWELVWNGVSEIYEYSFFGTDAPPGFGVHAVTVEADKFGYEYIIDSTQTLTLNVEPTILTPTWSPDNNITYFESTTLSVSYDMSNGTPISGATVNVTIGVDVWNLSWNSTSEAYETTISGSDVPPGYGTHTIEIRAWKFGYDSILDSTQQLTIRLEDSKISFVWESSSTITYLEETRIRIFYLLSNGTPIQGATVNLTNGPTRWDALWNSTSQAYELSWLGTDVPPGLGSHSLVIRAWKTNYVGITDVSQSLTINEEPTLIQASWSNGNNITYVETTKLLVNYTTVSGVVITGVLVNVTIGGDTWTLVWNASSQLYEKLFSGADSPPGLNTHGLSISGWRAGYELAIDGTQTLTLRIEPTTLLPSWLPSSAITYVESTTLSVRYETSYGIPISGATVNVTIATDTWVLTWNPVSEAYEKTFEGYDDPPGFGSHSLFIQAVKFGHQEASNALETLTIAEESTSLVISWSDGYNITYVNGTTLSVKYQMSNTSSIPSAVVNATIDGTTWTLTWNPSSEAYEQHFAGSDDPPGYGTNTVDIRASKFGYASILDSTQQLTIRLVDTSINFVWTPSDTITYVENTRIRIFYLMSNGTPITGATVNLTAGVGFWIGVWNSTNQAYEISFLGIDDPPGLDAHILTIRAWKVNYVGQTDVSQTLTINEEPTQTHMSWSDGNSITFVQDTTLLVSYTTSNGTVIPSALVNVTIGSDVWTLAWNSSSQLYEYKFSGSDEPPGFGTHGLSVRGWKFGYQLALNISAILTISGELGSISATLMNGNTITYIGNTILAVNYTMSNGTAIPSATINVTIDATIWNLTWHSASETYRIQFNGSDSPPGLGIHNLIVKAWRAGFDGVTDSTQFMTLEEEPTTLTAYWSAPNFNSGTYFDYTTLYVQYQMSNGSSILEASVNVTIDSTTWTLTWNATEEVYSRIFNGDDSPPGFGTHSLLLEAVLHGYADGSNSAHSLTLTKDPTTIQVSWTFGNNITYVESTVLSVVYRMSNGSNILGATVNVTIDSDLWILIWNGSAGAYQVQFDGDQIPPGFGTFTVDIQASGSVFVAQSPSTTLTLRTESTTATPSWSSVTIDWTESVILSFDFRDSYASLISDATTKFVYVDGAEYGLLGTNGTYWFEFDNSFDLGLHNVWVNFSKFGYDPATALSISFTINEARTDLTIVWSSTVIDYLGQIDLTVDYYYIGAGTSVPSVGVMVNITIDGTTTLALTLQGNRWVVNLTGVSLDLGIHTVDIRAQVYGYEYSESLGIPLTVNEVATDALTVTWNPSNLTIEYTDSLNLTVDFTFYGGDVPATSIVNVSVEGRLYDLTYSAGIWSVSIPGNELGIGIHSANISAWLYGYQLRTDLTVGINVTVAANSFIATWEPLSLQPTFIDTVNLSVIYTQDFVPIIGATVELSINGTIYPLVYSAIDEMWHFRMDASAIGLGVWNVTVTANKTGYADGWDSRLLTILLTPTNLTVLRSSSIIYYDESINLSIYYQLLNTSIVPGATCTVTVNSIVQSTSWVTDHWEVTLNGLTLGLGVHSVVVDVDSFGYESDTDSSDMTVNAIPTSVIVDSVTYTVFPFDSVTVLFTWFDDKNAVGIAGYAPDVIWLDTFSVVDHGNGSYSIELDNNALHVGFYDLNVTFARIGYSGGFRTVSIEVLELPIVLIFDDTIEEYENETVTVAFSIYDGPHANVVDWGEIVIELAGRQYRLGYNPGTQVYSGSIWLGSFAPGIYILNFTATAIDCETEYGEIQLEIIPKRTYTLLIEVDDEIQAGQSIEIIIQASDESGPMIGFSVSVHIIVERGQSAPQESIEVASDMLEFQVPSDATGLTIWAEFEGTVEEWPAISNTVNREVSPGGIDSLAFDPVTLTIVIGGVGGSIAGLIFLRRRRRGGIPTTSAVDPIIPSTSVPSAPIGEMDIVQDVIKKNPDGMTRAQIAQSLEISTSKASALVRKLLESESGFEEIREGRLRRIRFFEAE